jgi:transcriptional regulator with GAF, ATPase, and Fis domain
MSERSPTSTRGRPKIAGPWVWERFDRELHAEAIESLERKILELALERTGAQHGAVFLIDSKTGGLRVDFHVVQGVAVPLGDVILHHRADGRPNGIAFWVADRGEPYRTGDTHADPHYAPYFFDARSVAAVPIEYARKVIGVISVSSPEQDAFDDRTIAELSALAGSAAKFLRRAQLHRTRGREQGRELLVKGLSPEWLEIERVIERVAPTSAPVLVRGESGTGKELVANSIHFNSARASEPLVVVNCAAIPETLLESTLFGHVRGAFTGATQTREGELRRAHRGTVFLDELGELTPALQAKLLRAIEQGEIAPLGGGRTERVDVRVIAATNRDLETMMERGQFRSDLYYRVGVVSIELPPLRSFRQNVPILARVFLDQANRKHSRAVTRISAQAMSLLECYAFPGNLRELRNLIERAALLAPEDEITVLELPRSVTRGAPPRTVERPRGLEAMREEWLAPLERAYLEELLARTKGHVREAARRSGLSPATFYRLLRRRGLSGRFGGLHEDVSARGPA